MLDNEASADPKLIIAHQAAYKQNRLLAICLAGTALAVLAEAVALVSVFPLKTIEPRYIEINSSKDTYIKILPGDMPKEQKLLIIRKMLRGYVECRHSLDWITEKVRFKRVLAMSSPDVQSRFQEEFKRSKTDLKDVLRRVEIISDIELDAGLHQIEFKTVDSLDGHSQEKFWVVNIKYQIKDEKVRADDELLNPMNIYITKYTWTSRTNVKQEGAKNDE